MDVAISNDVDTTASLQPVPVTVVANHVHSTSNRRRTPLESKRPTLTGFKSCDPRGWAVDPFGVAAAPADAFSDRNVG